MAKKLKKAILAGLTAYAASKYLKGKKMPTDYEYDASIIKKPFKHDLEAVSPKKGNVVPKKWYEFWKKHGGSVTTAKLGSMIKAKQGTYAREDESLGMRLGKGKGTAKERDMSYGKWGNRGKDWAKSGKMIKARYGTEVRTDGSNPHVPKGGSGSIATKLNGKVTFKTF